MQVSFAQDFCKFNKTPSDDTFLEEPTGGVFDVGYCCCFTSLEVFTCPGYLSLLPALHPGFPGPWRPPPALSSTLATFDCFTFARLFHHSFTASATVLSGCFLPTGFFLPCTPYPHFVTILWLRCWQEHPIQDPLLACPHKVVRRGWRLKDGLELLTL